MYGVIEDVSEIVRWKIPYFFEDSSFLVTNEFLQSPPFSLAGCTWHLRVYPGNFMVGRCRVISPGRWLSAFLYLNDNPDPPKTVIYSFGFMRADGIVEEVKIGTTRFQHFDLRRGWTKFFDLADLRKRKSELVPLDTLTFTCRIELVAATSGNIAPKLQKVDSSPTTFLELEDLSSDLKNMLSKEETCDFTVNVKGKEFRSHRFVLAARSPVFGAMLQHDTAEARSGVLNVPDCHLESFQDFLNFLYTGKIEDVSFETAYHLYSTAEKYDVQRLKSICADYLRQSLSVDTICQILILSDQFSDHQLQSSAQDFFNKNSLQIFLTSDWHAMLKYYYRLASKVLKEMAHAGLKKSCNTVQK